MAGFILIGVGILIALLVWFVLWRLPNLPVRIISSGGGVLLTVLCIAMGTIYLAGVNSLNQTYPNPPSNLTAATAPERIARGERLANLCAGCHSSTMVPPLDGSANSLLASPDGSTLGDLYAPNLTPGGHLKNMTDGEIIRAIREGVNKDGKPLLIMPSEIFKEMSDDDVSALVGYLRNQRAVDKPTPPRELNFIGIMLMGAGQLPLITAQAPITQPIVAPPQGATAEYGRYLVGISGCRACHGVDLAGGTVTEHGPPAGPNLTVIVPNWSETEFLRTIRTGNDPAGHPLNPEMMPWKEISAAYGDDELRGMYAFLKSLQPIRR